MSRIAALRLALLPPVALAMLACAAPEPAAPAPAVDRQDGLSPGRHVYTTADGNDVPYVVRGGGATTVVLVHCWMCDRTFWDAQIPALEERYRVIALDLPGHGEAGAEREAWTVEAFGHDVAGLIDRLDLRDVVLVGHSMGGPVSLKAAALARDRVRGIVAVDTLHDAEFDFHGPGMEQMLAMFDSDFRATCASMVDRMFIEEGADEIIAEVRVKGCQTSNVAVGQALIRDFGNIDFPLWFREAGVPIRAINAAVPHETKIDVNRKYADFDAVLMEGVGHYLQMTRPDEFNQHLLRTLDQLAGPSMGQVGSQASPIPSPSASS